MLWQLCTVSAGPVATALGPALFPQRALLSSPPAPLLPSLRRTRHLLPSLGQLWPPRLQDGAAPHRAGKGFWGRMGRNVLER